MPTAAATKSSQGTSSWWLGQPQPGLTVTAAQALRTEIVLSVDTVAERVFVQRQQMLSALQALRANRRTVGICHANVVANH